MHRRRFWLRIGVVLASKPLSPVSFRGPKLHSVSRLVLSYGPHRSRFCPKACKASGETPLRGDTVRRVRETDTGGPGFPKGPLCLLSVSRHSRSLHQFHRCRVKSVMRLGLPFRIKTIFLRCGPRSVSLPVSTLRVGLL